MNNREDKKIYILVEPSYITPVWFSSSIDGIRSAAGKQKKAVRQLEELEELNTLSEKPKAIILISTNTQWTRHSIDYCRAENIRTILIGGMPSRFGEDVSGTIYSSKSSIDEMLNYFKSCNRKRIALLGINEMGSNDAAKAEVFLNSVRNLGIPASDDDIYYNSPDSRNPNERFFDNIGRYNAVICSNDYIAAYVLAFAKDYGITVPEDLYVAGLGDSILCQYTTPSLTSATRPYFKTGEQAFNIWKQLNSDSNIVSVTVTVQCEIKPRESTACAPLPQSPVITAAVEKESLLPPNSVLESSNSIRALANCLSQCDRLDMDIIREVLDGISTEQLAEDLFISTSTARYRLKKIYAMTNTNSRREFVALFNRHISYPQIFDDIYEYKENSPLSDQGEDCIPEDEKY